MMLDISAKYLEDVLRKIPKSKNMPRNIKMSKNGSITYSIKRFAFPGKVKTLIGLGKIENKQSHNALKTEKLKSFSNKKSVDENHSRMKRLQLKTYSHFRVNTDNTPNQFAFQNNALFRITSDVC